MVTKLQLRSAIVALCMTLTTVCAAAYGDEVPLVTGKHWTDSSEQQKKAYLIGIANMLQVEIAYAADNSSPDAHSLAHRFAKGLKGQTLDTVRDRLDRWYAAHPDQLQRPVIETIWFEIVVPGLQKNS